MKKKAPPHWTECAMCVQQIFGGPRCFAHNPTPEQRAARPDLYPRMKFVRRRRRITDPR